MKAARKKLISALVVAVVAVGLDGTFNEAKAGTTYSLFCRGGDTQAITFNYDRWWAAQFEHVEMIAKSSFTFTKSTKPYSPNTLKASECAWVDRGMSATEPSVAKYDAKTTLDETFVEVKLAPKPQVKTTIAGKVQNQASWRVLDALSNKRLIAELKVTAASGYFKVASVGMILAVPSTNP